MQQAPATSRSDALAADAAGRLCERRRRPGRAGRSVVRADPDRGARRGAEVGASRDSSVSLAAPAASASPERASAIPAAPAPVEARQAADEEEHPLVLRLPVGTRLADAERKLILLTLEAVRGNKQRAARVLGISRRGLYSKLQAYGEHVTAADAEAQEQAENEANADEASPEHEGPELDAPTA